MPVFGKKSNDTIKKASAGFKGLVDDLTHLEINTIIKNNMVAGTMPRNLRKALWDLAGKYDMALSDFKDKYKEYLDKVNPETVKDYDDASASEWKFGGRWSFSILRKRAKALGDIMREILEDNLYANPAALEKDIMAVTRMRIFSNEIVNIFETIAARKGATPTKPATVNADTGDLTSVAWNNDIHLHQILNTKEDLGIQASERLVIKKAYDLGSEEIVMQTIIALDGDVTNRIMKEFATNPNQAVIGVHNKGVQDSVGFWKTLVEIVSSWFTNRNKSTGDTSNE